MTSLNARMLPLSTSKKHLLGRGVILESFGRYSTRKNERMHARRDVSCMVSESEARWLPALERESTPTLSERSAAICGVYLTVSEVLDYTTYETTSENRSNARKYGRRCDRQFRSLCPSFSGS